MASNPSLGISPRAIRPVGTLHLTLGILNLDTEERKTAACDFLRGDDVSELVRKMAASVTSEHLIHSEAAEASQTPSCNVSGDRDLQSLTPASRILPFTTTLSGLHPMQKHASTSVLYASPIDHDSCLRDLCTALHNVFKAANLLIHEDRPLLLHATLVNTIYDRSRGYKGSKFKKSTPYRFKASKLIDQYQAFEWAKDVHLEKLSICKMKARQVIENGVVVDEEYEELGHMDLP